MKSRRQQLNPNLNPDRILKNQDVFQDGDEFNPQLIWQIVSRSKLYKKLVDDFIQEFNDKDSDEDLEISNFFTRVAEDGIGQGLLDIRAEGRENSILQDGCLTVVKETPKFIKNRHLASSIENFRKSTNYLIDFPIYYEVTVIPDYYFLYFNFFHPIRTKWPAEEYSSNVFLNLSFPKKYILRQLGDQLSLLQAKLKQPIFNNFKALSPNDFLYQLLIWDACQECSYTEISKKTKLSISDIRRKRKRIQILINEFERYISE